MSVLRAPIQRAALEAEQARLVAEALREGGERPATGRSAAGDPQRLRGIPMIRGS